MTRCIIITLCLQLVTFADDLRVYRIQPEFIQFMLSHELSIQSEWKKEDPFADPYETKFSTKNINKKQGASPREAYLRRLKAADHGKLFLPNDRIYDAHLLLKKFKITLQSNSHVLYNASTHNLFCFNLKETAYLQLEHLAKLQSPRALKLLRAKKTKIIADKDTLHGDPAVKWFSAPNDLLQLLGESNLPLSSNDDPFAEPTYPAGMELITQYHNLLTNIQLLTPPEIPGISGKEDLCIDITKLLKKSGILFRDDEWAVYNHTRSKVISYSSPQSLDILESILMPLDCGGHSITNIGLSAYIVTVPSSKKTQNYTSLISSDYTVEHSFDSTLRSGEKSKFQSSKYSSDCEFEATLGDNGHDVDLRLHIKTPKLSYTSAFPLLDKEPIAFLLKKEQGIDTYLLIQANILRNRLTN